MPTGCTSQYAFVEYRTANLLNRYQDYLRSTTAEIWQDANSQLAPSDQTLRLCDGQVIIHALSDTTIILSEAKISLAKGAVVLIETDSNGSSVLVLHDSHLSSVHIAVCGHSLAVEIGQTINIAKTRSDILDRILGANLAIRSLRMVQNDKLCAAISEYSLLSLCSASHLTSELVRGKWSNTAVAKAIVRSAAALGIATAQHGSFKKLTRYDLEGATHVAAI